MDKAKCTLCGLCVRVCPAAHLGKYTPNQDEIVRTQSMNFAYARDDRVRWMGSSGGVARALIHFALSSGSVDAAYSLIYPGVIGKTGPKSLSALSNTPGIDSRQWDLVHPVEEEAEGSWLNQTIPYQAIPRSLYRPVMWGKNITRIEKKWLRVLLVGLPCQLKSARYYMDIAHRNISVLAVTILCRKQKTFGHTHYLKRLVQAEKARDQDVFYRGGGWPGNSGVFTKDGPKCTPFFYFAQCWNLPACIFCTDPLNARFSDITLADPWGLMQPAKGEHGKNLVLTWSLAGDALLRAADAVLVRQNLTPELALPSLDFNAIEQKDIRARSATLGHVGLSLKTNQAWRALRIKTAELLVMHFTHQSFLFRLVQTVKTILFRYLRLVLHKGSSVQ